jgi:GTP-binding protein
MQIRSVEYRTSALKASGVPRQWIPHVAVAGRSNVGKSSLLNWLLRRSVARVAKAPGKTRTLNFFLINENLYLVDLPGYGYAKVGKKLQQEWGRELTRYLVEEPRLAGVVTLVDVRHGPTALDLQLQGLIAESGLERVVVLTYGERRPGGTPGRVRLPAVAGSELPRRAGRHLRLADPDQTLRAAHRRHGRGQIRAPKEGERYFAIVRVNLINFEDPEVAPQGPFRQPDAALSG